MAIKVHDWGRDKEEKNKDKKYLKNGGELAFYSFSF